MARSSGFAGQSPTSSDRGASVTILVRADASSAAGTGHVMRCLALGEAAKAAGHRVVLASIALPEPLARVVRARGLELRQLDPTHRPADVPALADEEDAAWVVVDGYAYRIEDLLAMRGGRRLLVVDDHAELPSYPADIVVNANAYASRDAYAGRTGRARLLLGPRFALLRSEFARYAMWRRTVPDQVAEILVTMGGSDPAGATELVIGAVDARRGAARLMVVVGASNHRAADLVERHRHRGTEIRQAVDDMASLMADADVAIAAAGSTTWELAYMQVPILAVVTADNQVGVAAALEQRGVAESLGRVEDLDADRIGDRLGALLADPARRRAMAASGRELVDGRGARRVVAAMSAAGVSLRSADMDDAAELFAWANDPGTRAASFHSAPIPWEEHVSWLEARLKDPDSILLIALEHGPVGQVRFERTSNDEAVISVGLAPRKRGRGLAGAVIDAGAQEIFDRWPIARIRADIRSDNHASLAAFADAGFAAGEPHPDRADAVSMWLQRASSEEQRRPR